MLYSAGQQQESVLQDAHVDQPVWHQALIRIRTQMQHKDIICVDKRLLAVNKPLLACHIAC